MIAASWKTLERLRRNQYLPPAELRAFQEEKLRRLVRHAYDNVAYYRDLFDREGIKPSDIRGLDDLARIPVTAKKDIQGLPPEKITAGGTPLGDCVVKSTSGSTGQPLKIFLSPAERDFQILLNLRILMENGLRLTDRMTYIINPHRFPKGKHWFQRLGILRRDYLSVFDHPRIHAEALKRQRPEAVYGYPSNLTLLALYLKEEGIAGIRPRAVFSVAEALEPAARSVIDEVLGARTRDILGTIEVGDIAWECPHGQGYHTSADAVIIEYLRDGRPVPPGEEGRIVCTSLYGYVMPFIRYAVDDICVSSDRTCPCGRTLPLMESIRGRANDFIVLPDGRIVASCFLVITMQSIYSVAQYRVIQERADSLTVQVVPGAGYDGSTARRIKEEMEKAVQNRLTVNVLSMNSLPRDHSGKIRTVVSRIIPGLQEKVTEARGIHVDISGGTPGKNPSGGAK